jgi:hypothetical protein
MGRRSKWCISAEFECHGFRIAAMSRDD